MIVLLGRNSQFTYFPWRRSRPLRLPFCRFALGRWPAWSVVLWFWWRGLPTVGIQSQMTTAVLANENHLTRRSSKRDVNGAVRCASNLSDTARDGATGLTNYVGHANLDWEPKCESAEVAPKQRSLSFRRAIRTSSFRKKTQVGTACVLHRTRIKPGIPA